MYNAIAGVSRPAGLEPSARPHPPHHIFIYITNINILFIYIYRGLEPGAHPHPPTPRVPGSLLPSEGERPCLLASSRRVLDASRAPATPHPTPLSLLASSRRVLD